MSMSNISVWREVTIPCSYWNTCSLIHTCPTTSLMGYSGSREMEQPVPYFFLDWVTTIGLVKYLENRASYDPRYAGADNRHTGWY